MPSASWYFPGGLNGWWEDSEPFHREVQVLHIVSEEIPWSLDFAYAALKNVPVEQLCRSKGWSPTNSEVEALNKIKHRFFDVIERAYP